MKDNTNDINIEIGNRLKDCRKTAGLTQRKLAEMVNISVQHLSYIECGKRRLTADLAKSISEVIDVSLDYLLLENDFKSLHDQLQADHKYNEFMCDIVVKFFNFMDVRIDFLCSVEKSENYYPEKIYGNVFSPHWICKFNNGVTQRATLEEVKLSGKGVTFFKSELGHRCIDTIYLSQVEFAVFISDMIEYSSFLLYRLRNTLTGQKEDFDETLNYFSDSSSNLILNSDHLFVKKAQGGTISKETCKNFGDW